MIHNRDIANVKFPADPLEFNGTDLTKMSEKHKILNRELVASGMNYAKVAMKYGYHKDTIYKIARMGASKAYRAWLGETGRQNQIASAQEVLETLTDILREDAYDEHITPGGMTVIKKVDTKDRLKSAEILTKVYGMQENKPQDTSNVIVVDIEGEDDDEDILTIEAGE